ncbi:MAG: hypothetical protein JWP00_3840 [Chloroflexi bacterium]|jgi:hypothetical protein|nr:hypothetical protein [Chloroflexota bacterium]
MEESQAKAVTHTTEKKDGCSVDWSWLQGRTIAAATNDLKSLTIQFEGGQTFKIQALTYKGEAFLSFMPYQDPDKIK